MKEIAIKWLKQGLHDLEMARKNVEIGGYDVAAFLAHQSVEKLLKALFAIKGKEIPKIHYRPIRLTQVRPTYSVI